MSAKAAASADASIGYLGVPGAAGGRGAPGALGAADEPGTSGALGAPAAGSPGISALQCGHFFKTTPPTMGTSLPQFGQMGMVSAPAGLKHMRIPFVQSQGLAI